MTAQLLIRRLGLTDYLTTLQAMREFTDNRDASTPDEMWLLEHSPVFTQGQNGKPEHLLQSGPIPVVKTDRGGQITYHGPGQLVVYTLIDIQRKHSNVRTLVTQLEQAVIDYLSTYHIEASAKHDAPGVYCEDKKICSIGLRIRRGRAYHGIAFNVNMDLTPFSHINPCGYAGLQMTQLSDLGGPSDVHIVGQELITYLMNNLGYNSLQNK